MKKRALALLLTVMMVCGLLVPTASAEGQVQTTDAGTASNPVMATYYVSPNGSDNNDGTSQSAPFKTLEKARDTVRTINGDMTGDIVVYPPALPADALYPGHGPARPGGALHHDAQPPVRLPRGPGGPGDGR